MKIFLKILFYLSFVFVFVYLYVNELLIIPNIKNIYWFLASLALILIGFMWDSKSWQIIAKQEIDNVSFKNAYISNGKYIFSKYIPGKVWIIVGKAAYLKEKYNKSVINLSSYSFYLQLISLFAASLISVYLLYFINIPVFWGVASLIAICIVFFTFLHKPSLNLLSKGLSFLFKKPIILPTLPLKLSLKVFLYSFINWAFLSASFFVFLISILPADEVSLKMGVLFPMSSIIGIIVLIAPGGLAVREGFLILGLSFLGVATKEATAVAFISRLWFLVGESLFFISSLLIDSKLAKSISPNLKA